jgi:phosphopantetheine adenylyltransferase
LEKAKANVAAASQDLDIAREDSAEYANYKIESGKKLRENELLIADMKDKMKSERKETTVKYEKQLDSLSRQNSQLRNNMHTYNSAGKANWELFKKGFNKELDALGKSISQLAERNQKKGS